MSQSLGPPLRLVTFSLFPCLFAYPQRVSEKRRPLCGCCSCSFLPKMYTFYSQFNLTISRFRFPARPFAFSRFLGSREPGRELSAQVNLCARTQLDTKSSAVDSGIASRGSRLAPVAGSLIVVPGLGFGFGFLPISLGVPLSRLRPLDKPHNPAPFFRFSNHMSERSSLRNCASEPKASYEVNIIISPSNQNQLHCCPVHAGENLCTARKVVTIRVYIRRIN